MNQKNEQQLKLPYFFLSKNSTGLYNTCQRQSVLKESAYENVAQKQNITKQIQKHTQKLKNLEFLLDNPKNIEQISEIQKHLLTKTPFKIERNQKKYSAITTQKHDHLKYLNIDPNILENPHQIKFENLIQENNKNNLKSLQYRSEDTVLAVQLQNQHKDSVKNRINLDFKNNLNNDSTKILQENFDEQQETVQLNKDKINIRLKSRDKSPITQNLKDAQKSFQKSPKTNAMLYLSHRNQTHVDRISRFQEKINQHSLVKKTSDEELDMKFNNKNEIIKKKYNDFILNQKSLMQPLKLHIIDNKKLLKQKKEEQLKLNQDLINQNSQQSEKFIMTQQNGSLNDSVSLTHTQRNQKHNQEQNRSSMIENSMNESAERDQKSKQKLFDDYSPQRKSEKEMLIMESGKWQSKGRSESQNRSLRQTVISIKSKSQKQNDSEKEVSEMFQNQTFQALPNCANDEVIQQNSPITPDTPIVNHKENYNLQNNSSYYSGRFEVNPSDSMHQSAKLLIDDANKKDSVQELMNNIKSVIYGDKNNKYNNQQQLPIRYNTSHFERNKTNFHDNQVLSQGLNQYLKPFGEIEKQSNLFKTFMKNKEQFDNYNEIFKNEKNQEFIKRKRNASQLSSNLKNLENFRKLQNKSQITQQYNLPFFDNKASILEKRQSNITPNNIRNLTSLNQNFPSQISNLNNETSKSFKPKSVSFHEQNSFQNVLQNNQITQDQYQFFQELRNCSPRELEANRYLSNLQIHKESQPQKQKINYYLQQIQQKLEIESMRNIENKLLIEFLKQQSNDATFSYNKLSPRIGLTSNFQLGEFQIEKENQNDKNTNELNKKDSIESSKDQIQNVDNTMSISQFNGISKPVKANHQNNFQTGLPPQIKVKLKIIDQKDFKQNRFKPFQQLNLFVGTTDLNLKMQNQNIQSKGTTSRSVNSKNISDALKKSQQKENANLNASMESEMTSQLKNKYTVLNTGNSQFDKDKIENQNISENNNLSAQTPFSQLSNYTPTPEIYTRNGAQFIQNKQSHFYSTLFQINSIKGIQHRFQQNQ